MAFSRLQKLGITVCKAVTNRKITEVALGYSKKVKTWKESIKKKKEENVTAPSCTIAETQVEVVRFGYNLFTACVFYRWVQTREGGIL